MILWVHRLLLLLAGPRFADDDHDDHDDDDDSIIIMINTLDMGEYCRLLSYYIILYYN